MWQRIRSFFVAAEAQPSDAPRARITTVAILLENQDRSTIAKVCEGNQWDVVFADTCTEAREVMKQLKPQIILLDRDLADGDWRHALSAFASSSSGACTILISRVADDYLWNEVVCNGGYDVLAKPLREQDLLRALKFAWFYWNGTRQTAAIPRK
jgi:DNA-binding NtrC family response regulator